jgi:uncharacterized membrane protein YdjX (TVP38/TMEM64 family)
MLDINDMLELLRNYSSIAIPISLLISIAIALVGVLPSVFVTGANIIFFGPINGFIISLLGETIGAYITFIVYRLGFRKRLEKVSDKHKLISRIVNSDGKRAGLLICEARIIPFIPSGIVTLAASISNVNNTIFTVATLIGKAPSIAIEALVSYDVVNIYNNRIRLVITVVSLILIGIIIKKKESS